MDEHSSLYSMAQLESLNFRDYSSGEMIYIKNASRTTLKGWRDDRKLAIITHGWLSSDKSMAVEGIKDGTVPYYQYCGAGAKIRIRNQFLAFLTPEPEPTEVKISGRKMAQALTNDFFCNDPEPPFRNLHKYIFFNLRDNFPVFFSVGFP